MDPDIDLRKPEKGKKKKSKGKKLKDADGDDVANAFTGNMYSSQISDAAPAFDSPSPGKVKKPKKKKKVRRDKLKNQQDDLVNDDADMDFSRSKKRSKKVDSEFDDFNSVNQSVNEAEAERLRKKETLKAKRKRMEQ